MSLSCVEDLNVVLSLISFIYMVNVGAYSKRKLFYGQIRPTPGR